MRGEGKTGGRRAICSLKNLGGFAPSREITSRALAGREEAHAKVHEERSLPSSPVVEQELTKPSSRGMGLIEAQFCLQRE